MSGFTLAQAPVVSGKWLGGKSVAPFSPRRDFQTTYDRFLWACGGVSVTNKVVVLDAAESSFHYIFSFCSIRCGVVW